MATALTTVPNIKWVGSRSGGQYHSVTVAEAASQTFKIGDPIVYDLSANGVALIPNTSGVPTAIGVYGIALTAATGTTASPIDVLIPTGDDIFSAALASAEDTFVAPDQDNRGQLGGLILMDAANGTMWAVDEDVATHCQILGVDPSDLAKRGGSPADATTPTMSAGDRVLFRFTPRVLDITAQVA